MKILDAEKIRSLNSDRRKHQCALGYGFRVYSLIYFSFNQNVSRETFFKNQPEDISPGVLLNNPFYWSAGQIDNQSGFKVINRKPSYQRPIPVLTFPLSVLIPHYYSR